MRKSVGQAPTAEQANKHKKKVLDLLLQRSGRTNTKKKCRTGSHSGEGEQTQKKKCQTSSNIGAEWENHNVGQGPTWDQKGLIQSYDARNREYKSSLQSFPCAYPEPRECSISPPILFREVSFNIPPSTPGCSKCSVFLCFRTKCSVFLCFRTETLMHFYFPPYVPYAPTILSALVCLPE